MSTHTSASITHPKVLRINAVIERPSLSRSTIYRLIDQGSLTPIKLGPNSIGFLASDIDAWIMARKVESMQIEQIH